MLYKPSPRIDYSSGRRDFVCDHPDCHNAPDAPMIRHDLWNTISNPKGLLCIQHTEELLGRPLTIYDLAPVVSNAFTMLLYDRLACGINHTLPPEHTG